MGIVGKSIEDIHVGELISSWLKKNMMTKTKFAQIMELPMTNAGRILSNQNIDLSKLIEISKRLQHNFIADICEEPKYVKYLHFEPLNIGHYIEQRLKILKMSQAEFAKAMGIYQSDVSKLLKKESIGTDKLVKISRVLDHNFFRAMLPMDLSDPELYDSALKDAAQLAFDMVKDDLYRVIGEKDEEIISLRNENNKLKSQIAKLQKKNTELRKRINIPDAEGK